MNNTATQEVPSSRDLNPSLEEQVVEKKQLQRLGVEGDAAVWCAPRRPGLNRRTCLQKLDKTTQMEPRGRKSPE